MDQNTIFSDEDFNTILEFLQQKTNIKPKIGIICGSGLGTMGEAVTNALIIDYKDIPKFPVSTAPGHKGRLIIGYIAKIPVICMQGRFHHFEGYSLSTCAMPVRIMKRMGCTHLIASNAAGGINQSFKVGDIMIIKDHVNLMGFAGNNPLRGPNDPRFGTRFFAMTDAYNAKIRKSVKEIARTMGLGRTLQEGVYSCVGGPNYETIAELQALQKIGVDAVGMSTVPEIITARHCDMTCFAFSLITNMCSLNYENEATPDAAEVLDVGKMQEGVTKAFVEKIVEHIGQNY